MIFRTRNVITTHIVQTTVFKVNDTIFKLTSIYMNEIFKASNDFNVLSFCPAGLLCFGLRAAKK